MKSGKIGIVAVNESVKAYEQEVIKCLQRELEAGGIELINYPYNFHYTGPDSVKNLIDEATKQLDSRVILITDIVARGSQSFSEAVSQLGDRRIWPLIIATHAEDAEKEMQRDKTAWFATTRTRKWMPITEVPYLPCYDLLFYNFVTNTFFEDILCENEVGVDRFRSIVRSYIEGDGKPITDNRWHD